MTDQEIDKKRRERDEHKGDERIGGENKKGRGQITAPSSLYNLKRLDISPGD